MKRTRIIAAIVAACLLCGCQRATAKTIYSSETLRIEVQGKKTIIRDLAANKEYVLIRGRRRKTAQESGPKTLIQTATLTIIAQGRTTVIKAGDGLTLTIERNKIKAHQ